MLCPPETRIRANIQQKIQPCSISYLVKYLLIMINPLFIHYLHYENLPKLEDFLSELKEYTSPEFKVSKTLKRNNQIPYTEVIFKKDRAEVQIGVLVTKDDLKTENFREIDLLVKEFEDTKKFGKYMTTYYKPATLKMMELDVSNINQVVYQFSFRGEELVLKIIVPNTPVVF